MMDTPLEDLTQMVIGAAIDIHKRFGPGLLESVYEVLLAKALNNLGLQTSRQLAVPLMIDGIYFAEPFRIDLLVNNALIVEIKSTASIVPLHSKQLLTYLRLMSLPLGLLINFGGVTLKEGIKRVVNDLPPGDSPALRVNRAD